MYRRNATMASAKQYKGAVVTRTPTWLPSGISEPRRTTPCLWRHHSASGALQTLPGTRPILTIPKRPGLFQNYAYLMHKYTQALS